MLTQISFFILGFLATVMALVVVSRRWPVSAAMFLIVFMMLLAGMYGVLGAHFPAVSQIIVYAGAIMVVFIFVIMLLNLPPDEIRYGRLTLFEWVLALLGVVVALVLGTRVGYRDLAMPLTSSFFVHARPPYYADENVKNISALMFTDYLWAFELVSFLILVAVIGAIVIAKKNTSKGANDHAEHS